MIDKVVMMTGGSAGTGLAPAEALARAGWAAASPARNRATGERLSARLGSPLDAVPSPRKPTHHARIKAASTIAGHPL